MGKMNGTRRKKLADSAPLAASAISEMLYCPKGHRLPTYTPKGQCTGVYCADESFAVAERKLTKEERAHDTALVESEEADPVAADSLHIHRAERLLAARLKALGITESEDPAEIEAWADKKLLSMLKTAIAEMDGRLRWGDDKERWEAAQQVLSSTGRGKRGEGISGTSPIIIVAGDSNGRISLPWVNRAPSIATVDAKALVSGEGNK